MCCGRNARTFGVLCRILRPGINDFRTPLRSQIWSTLDYSTVSSAPTKEMGFQYSFQRSLDRPSLLVLTHFAWKFLYAADCRILTITHPRWRAYTSCRATAATSDLSTLRATPTAPGEPSKLFIDRSQLFGCALLLRFHFVYRDMVRWLSEEYINRH